MKRCDEQFIVIRCNRVASKHIMEALNYMKRMGEWGCTRDFQIGDDCPKWFTFDGDGPDRIHSLDVVDADDIRHSSGDRYVFGKYVKGVNV